MTTYALRLENGTDTAARVRMADLLALPAGPAPLTSKSALRADGGGAVTVSTGTMNVNVAPFIAWVQGGISVVQAGYPFVNDAAVALAIAPGHASLSRTDTIAGVVRDNAYDSSGQVLASVVVVAGTPGAGAPVLPTNSVPLRDIVVQAGVSAGNGGLQPSNLSTDRRTYIGQASAVVASFNSIGATAAGTVNLTRRGGIAVLSMDFQTLGGINFPLAIMTFPPGWVAVSPANAVLADYSSAGQAWVVQVNGNQVLAQQAVATGRRLMGSVAFPLVEAGSA